ncbi:MAG: lipid A deacylase LpxR family protein [Alphaproteobacteria bacterium]
MTKSAFTAGPRYSARRARHLAGVLAILLVLFPATALAETEVDDSGTINLIIENDLFGSGTDRHFTHGTKLSYSSREFEVPDENHPVAIVAGLVPFWPQGARARASYAIGQNIYTPEDISAQVPDPDDRPYAGWLYLSSGLTAVSPDARRSDSVVLEIGMVGPASLAEHTQVTWHDTFGFPDPNGWDSQLKNEPGFSLIYEHSREIWQQPLGLGLNADLVPNAGFAIGNVATYLSGGVTLRLGHDLTADLGPPRIRPSLPGSSYLRPVDGFNWYTFGSLGARLVGRNIFLDGNTFSDSPSVDKRYLVGDLQAGLVLQYSDWRFSYTYTIRTEEFYGQDQVNRFGALGLSFRF